MPFDDLTTTQQDFIAKYFKTGAIRQKTKEKYSQFNTQLALTVSPLYDRINTCSGLIGRIEEAEAEAPEDSPKVPIEYYRNLLIDLEGRIEKTLSSNRKLLKDRVIPNFDSIESDLKNLEKRLNDQLQKAHSGTRAETLTGSEKLLHSKEMAFNSAQKEANLHKVATDKAYYEAKDKMGDALMGNIRARDAQYMSYCKLYDTLSRDLTELLKRDAEKDEVSLKDFSGDCDHLLSAFKDAGDEAKQQIEKLGNAPAVTQEQLNELKNGETYRDLDAVKISKKRVEGLNTELAKLTGDTGAIQKQTDKLNALREEYRQADDSEKAKLKKEFEVQTARIEQLELRRSQLAEYRDTQLSRDRQILASADIAREADERARALQNVLNDEDGDISELDLDWVSGEATGLDSEILVKQIEEFEKAISKAAERDLNFVKLSPDEPTPKQLSGPQKDTLLLMLSGARKLIDEGRGDLAEKIYKETYSLKLSFQQANFALMLPEMSAPTPSPAQALVRRLEDIRSDANDIWGQGVDAAANLAQDAKTLIGTVEADEVRGAFIETPALHADAVTNLRNRVDELAPEEVAPTVPREKKVAATDKANEIASFLDSALKTVPLTDTDIIEAPGVVYSEQARKHLVPPDHLIMVEVDGKMEQHKIVTKVRRGAIERASDERSNKVPVEVLEAMVSRNHTLRAMAETDAPGGEAMLDTYMEEANAWFEDVSKHGEKIYPALAGILKDCDKIFAKGEVATYKPDTFAKVKTMYDAFKDGYLKKKPTEALGEGVEIKRQVEALEKTADEIVKPAYKDTKEIYDEILRKLTGKTKRGDDGENLGKLMEGLLAKPPEELFTGMGALPKETSDDLAEALKQFKNVQKFYTENKSILSPTNVEGEWMTQAKTANKLLDTKIQSNIYDARTQLRSLKTTLHDYHESMSSLDPTDGEAMAAKLIELSKNLLDGAKAAREALKTRAAFHRKLDTVKPSIATTIKDLKGLGKNPVAQNLKQEADALEARRKAADAKAKGDEDYAAGLSELEDIEAELEKITENMVDLDPSKRQKIKHIRIGERLSTLQTTLDKLTARASTLAKSDIEPKMSESQALSLKTQVGVVDTSLKKVENLISLTELKKITDEIDRLNDDEENSWKAKRMTEREKALKEMRAIRAKLETHPAATLYAKNPFDGGMNMRLMLSALHHVEVAVLSCVSPKDPD